MKIEYTIPSLGQFIQGRIVAGLVIAISFYGSIYLLLFIWKGINLGFYFLLPAWFFIWLYSYLDALGRGERRRKPFVAVEKGARREDLPDSSQEK